VTDASTEALLTSLAELYEIRRLLPDRRERIATAAMVGLLRHTSLDSPAFVAEHAVKYADALIAQLDEEPQP
jgi:hypothetical protein